MNAQTTPQNGPAPLAELRDVTKQLGTTRALDRLTMQINPGELVALLGPNGCGKTTAISVLLGLIKPDSGSVRLLGGEGTDIAIRRRVGVVLQEAVLPGELTVSELIELAAAYYPDPMPTAEVLALTKTQAFADKRYATLSGGMKRLVQFGLAICGRPSLVFLDEPTTGLDIEARSALWDTVRALLAAGTSVLLTTHYLEEAEALASRVVVMAKGHVVAQGTVDEMRGYVTRKRVSCVTSVPLEEITSWTDVIHATPGNGKRLDFMVTNAESVVRRLLAGDISLSDLEVNRASLADAFLELTRRVQH